MRDLQNVIPIVILFYPVTALPIEEDTAAISEDRNGNDGQTPWNFLKNPGEMDAEGDLFSSDHGDNDSLGGNKINNTYSHWPNATIPYIIDSSYDSFQTDLIMSAMNIIEEKTCIRFVPYTNEGGYIDILNRSGCKSRIGYHGTRQIVHLQASVCLNLGNILHELLHVIGLYHEHTRPDRDNYVNVYMDNVENEHDFLKYNESIIDDFGVPYDYGSIMHYAEFSGSKNGLKTLEPKDSTWIGRIGQRERLSDSDILKIRLTYRCKDRT